MKIRLNISRKLLIRLAFFAALIGAAVLMDAYLEKNPAQLDDIQASSDSHSTNQGEVYVLAQANPISAKTFVQKTPTRKQHSEAHDKFLRQFYSVRNYQVLKAEVVQQTSPLIAAYHYLIYQSHSLSPDEDPLA
ncbi:hypothetical protein [Maribellus sp. YY47]|uniref:hypothetical protein n=1 Tax=Maribellus sp. YY47 TaxID=2929486 RepID=UPI0020015061|nr:hypothetical protein [Maribellus sp. YY47]MCK3683831.1 hypothetical protein [Maribellus sp. YY47]